jgi:Cupin-like domain
VNGPGPVIADTLPAGVLAADEPVLLSGLVAHWPLVQAARRSDLDFCAYLRSFGAHTPVGLWRGPPAIGGRFFYNARLDGFNFEREVGPFGALLDELLARAGEPEPPALYLGSTELEGSFPGLQADNDLPSLRPHSPQASLWLGNRARVALHFDLPDNVACVVAGRRRFTLFPPEQVASLYIGPLDFTPAGQPISLVDHTQPDLQRHPRYAQALEHARVFELAPGDALFIPSQWWHGVESLAPVNALVNFWWRQSPPHMDTPLNTLLLALLSVRDLPPRQRQAWRVLFDHYVFDADDTTAAHLPPHARGVLGPMSDDTARRLRAFLLNRLNR